MPTFQPDISIEYDDRKNISFITEKWTMDGAFHDEGAVALIALWNNMETALKVNNADLQLLQDGNPVPLRSILAASCVEGPRVTDYKITEAREGLLITNIQYSVTIEMKYKADSSSAVPSQEYSLSFQIGVNGLLTVSERGTYESDRVIPPSSVPFHFPGGDSYDFDVSLEYSTDRKRVTSSATWTEKRKKYPFPFITSGNYSISERYEQGMVYVSMSGSFELTKDGSSVNYSSKMGSAYSKISNVSLSAASKSSSQSVSPVDRLFDSEDAQRGASKVKDWVYDTFGSRDFTKDEFSLDPYSGTVTFSLEWVRSRSDKEYDYYIETWEYKENYQRKNLVDTLDGIPIKQKGGWTGVFLSQQGTAKKVGSYPKPAEPLYGSEDMISPPVVNYGEPVWGAEKQFVAFTVSWKYEFWFKPENKSLSYITNQIVEQMNNNVPSTL